MDLFEKIVNKVEKISIIGLGYVGLPIAVSFAKKVNVIGFDISKEKIEKYKMGIDPTNEVGNENLKSSNVEFTSDVTRLKESKFHIVAVPTPINEDKTPNLGAVISASRLIGKNLVKGSFVVYESTVYPGVTEDICVPILEKESGLKYGVDFKVGYSPERINPGDKVHRLETIVKVVSGMDQESLIIISNVYELVVEAGVYRAESIKVAEAAKVIENSQRDINIAFMNELSIIFNKMNIDTNSVLKAASTKWNFINFTPGLVGGHCIGVDPYYLTYKAEQLGYHSQIILSGRRINDDMGKYIADILIKILVNEDIRIKNSNIAILGFTFKENCPDTRNTRVIDIINELKQYGVNVSIFDPVANLEEAKNEYDVSFTKIEEIKNMDAVIIAVGHNEFKNFSKIDYSHMFRENIKSKILMDIKSILNRKEFELSGFKYWSL
jgi:UDP-N-acetyl-D-galactosamine dehydrogenase